MNVNFTPRAWYEYTGWQLEDKKILKRINLLIKDIERNGNTGIGKPEPLRNMDTMGYDPIAPTALKKRICAHLAPPFAAWRIAADTRVASRALARHAASCLGVMRRFLFCSLLVAQRQLSGE